MTAVACTAASALPQDNAQEEDEESCVYSFPAEYEGPIDPDFVQYM